MGVVTIFPGRESIKDVAKLLLSLAEHPRDVATTLDPGHGFVVDRVLFVKFEAAWKQEAKVPVETQVEAETNDDSPAKRKPGRPRKADKEE